MYLFISVLVYVLRDRKKVETDKERETTKPQTIRPQRCNWISLEHTKLTVSNVSVEPLNPVKIVYHVMNVRAS
jgi:ribosomal protein L14E/L6E/L27E